MNSRRISLLIVTGLMLVVALSACNSGGGTQPVSGGTNTFNVEATEFKFDPNTFNASAGQALTFKVTNKGTIDHNFVILNADGSQQLAKMEIKVGATNSLNFTPSAAGEYMIECDITGHKEAGMTGKLIVK